MKERPLSLHAREHLPRKVETERMKALRPAESLPGPHRGGIDCSQSRAKRMRVADELGEENMREGRRTRPLPFRLLGWTDKRQIDRKENKTRGGKLFSKTTRL